jgi:ribosome recycling factor
MQDIIKDSSERMQKALEAVKRNFSAVRTGRANPALLDHVKVNYYGSEVSLKQLASISVPEPRQIVLTPFDKNAAKEIEKAILTSDLGINPRIEAGLIRLFLPELSEERRKDLAKLLKKDAEEGKVALRNLRRDAIEEIKKQKADKLITEDQEEVLDKKIQDQTDKFTKEIDLLLSAKEKEILTV